MTEQERIQSIKSNGGEHLKNFKKENVTYNMCLVAVQSNGEAISYVPEQYRTEEIYQEACKHGGMVLGRVPKEYMSKEICEYAIASTGLALQYVPDAYRTMELCKKAVSCSSQAYWYVPIEYITPEFVVEVAHNSKYSYSTISSLPDSLKKSPFYYEVICIEPEFIWHIPRKVLTAKIGKAAIKAMGYTSVAEAVKARPELLSRLHISLYDHEACLNFVKSEYFKESTGKDRYGNWAYGFNTQEDEKNGRFYLDQKYTETYSLPNMMRWADVATPFLALNGYYIVFADERIVTEEMCRVAISSNPHSFEHIPEIFKTKEMCLFAFEKEPFLIKHFPEEYITEELALKAVQHSGFILNDLSDKYKTKEICLIAVSDEGSGKIESVPDSVLDKDIVLAYLHNTRSAVHELKKIPQQLWDYDVCLAAVEKDGSDLQYVPAEYLDYNMCIHAVRKSGSASKYVPQELFTEELALATVSYSQYEFKNIPKRCITEAVCLEALSHGDRYAGTILGEIPREIITQKICDVAIAKSPRSLEAVPEEFVTEDILLSVARRACALVPRNFPKRLRTKKFIQQLIETDSYIGKYLDGIDPID